MSDTSGFAATVYNSIRALAIGQPSGTRLFGNRELAKRLRVSVVTVQKAYSQLLREGMVTRIAGKGTFAGAATFLDPIPAAIPPGRRDVSKQLFGAIETGEYPFGKALPGFKELAAKYSISRTTVAACLRKAQLRGLVHRTGKRWYAGRRPATTLSLSRACFFTVSIEAFARLWVLEHRIYGPFFESFYNVMQKANVRLMRIEIPIDNVGHADKDRVQSLRNLMAREGDSFLGFTIMPHPKITETYLQEIDSCNSAYLVYNYESSKHPLLPLRNAVQVDVDERDLCRALLDAVTAYGHRTIAYVDTCCQPWSMNRGSVLQEVLNEFPGEFSLHSIGHPNNALAFADSKGRVLEQRQFVFAPAFLSMIEHLIRNRQCLPEFARELIGLASHANELRWENKYMLFLAGYLAELSKNPEITALILPSDRHAAEFESLCAQAGIRLPTDFSLFAFDNFAEYWSNMAGTVDRGAREEGHRAGHFFLRDMEVSIRPGITSKCKPYYVPRPGAGVPRKNTLYGTEKWKIIGRFSEEA